MMVALAQIEHEDLAMFLAAGMSGSGQAEFYSDRARQRVELEFLHAYIRINYRRLYARCLAAGLNHHNRVEVLFGLLAAGAPQDPAQRAEEGALIAAALDELPPQRVYRLIRRLRAERVNNRRTRAAIRGWLARRDRAALDAVKYRPGLMAAARHAHLSLAGEVGCFLFAGPDARRRWETPLLESYRRARYSREAIYELPMTVAEGLAAERGVSRRAFLEGIEEKMTAGERARIEASAAREGAKLGDLDLGRMPLTRLALLLLSLPLEARRARREALEAALARSARRAARGFFGLPARVAAVLDCSRSALGSREKRRRPLAVALAMDALLREGAQEYRGFWTAGALDPLLVQPRGQTDLAGPLLDALEWGARLVVVVSDGYENSPPGAAAEVLRLWQTRIEPGDPPVVVHLNPVFDPGRYAPRCLGDDAPALGVRDAEDAPGLLALARFVGGEASLEALEGYLEGRVARLLRRREVA
jgi:hypothetical protein